MSPGRRISGLLPGSVSQAKRVVNLLLFAAHLDASALFWCLDVALANGDNPARFA